jgi:hypothetical protein
LAGVAETAVEAVNDGKIAAWSMHKYIQSCFNVQVLSTKQLGAYINTFKVFSKYR